jgi:uncharacterized protein
VEQLQAYLIRNQTRQSTLARHVRLAGASRERRKGLSGLTKMPPGAGLWIMPCEAIHTFGMKMHIDVIFLDRDFRVRRTRAALGPNRIAFCLRASSVLELAPGSIECSRTQPGDHIEFSPVSDSESGN